MYENSIPGEEALNDSSGKWVIYVVK